jgi:CRP-like cAMP-binding protein
MKLDPTAFLADPELVQTLAKNSTSISCDKERMLFRQGDASTGLFILTSGTATLNMTSPARNEVVSLEATAGSLLGLPALLGGEPYTLSATAHAGAQFGFLSREEFTALMQTNPLISLKVLQVLAAEVRSARRAIVER